VIVGPDGALYFTDPTLDLVAGEKQEIPFQGVYRLDNAGNVRLLAKDLSQPNGLAFSPDGKRFYVDDSDKRNIRVYDVGEDGFLANGRIFGEEPGGKNEGVPDGIKVDQRGNLAVWDWRNPPLHRRCGCRDRCRPSPLGSPYRQEPSPFHTCGPVLLGLNRVTATEVPVGNLSLR
jgi:sugar lactone lactonase YvrE